MSQGSSPLPRVYYGEIPPGYMIPPSINVSYPPPAQLPVALHPAPGNFYPVAVQMANQPLSASEEPHFVYSAPPPPPRPANMPVEDYNLSFHIQAQQSQVAPGTLHQYQILGARPEAEAMARSQAAAQVVQAQAAQAQAIAQAAQQAAAAAQADSAGIRYYFGQLPQVATQQTRGPEPYLYGLVEPQTRAPEPYAYGAATQAPVNRPVSPTDYGSGDPQGRRFGYVRY